MTRGGIFLGITEGHFDPAVALVSGGEVLAYAEEERFTRYKHAPGIYPSRALRFCLDHVGADIADVAAVAVNWNTTAYADGSMRKFYDELARHWPVDPQTTAWQEATLRRFHPDALQARHELVWRRTFGDRAFPPLVGTPHHFTHAFHAAMQSPFDDAVCLTADGSGDQHTTVVWEKRGECLRCLRQIRIPHSLGWVYAAFTEYLGFEAYDGEYKVMGLAAYGEPRPDLLALLQQIVMATPDGIEFRVDPGFIHYGSHRFSGRFTDRLVCVLGRPPRRPDDEITQWHMDLAYSVQEALEVAIERLVVWAVRETGLAQICVGGGIGLNVKLNSRLFEHPEVRDIFVQPLCSDGGAAAGAALVACHQTEGCVPQPLETLALGNEETTKTVVEVVERANLAYERPPDICAATAGELAAGRIVGWFQGRMEAGPRALGQRSILVDPRHAENRDRVNAVVKHREPWRPFCPSLPEERAGDYFHHHTTAPFMTIAFRANERLAEEAPAVVHVDGTVRAQLVRASGHDRFHRLLRKFEDRTGVPILLNTSFNVNGEPIVCTAEDALRTFWATGLDALALDDLMIRKPRSGAPAP